jgi:excisionase family DNA binding protein
MALGLLTQREAARLLRVSVRTLERHRAAGTGPAYVLIGRLVRYRQEDLNNWLALLLRKPAADIRLPEPDNPVSSSPPA